MQSHSAFYYVLKGFEKNISVLYAKGKLSDIDAIRWVSLGRRDRGKYLKRAVNNLKINLI